MITGRDMRIHAIGIAHLRAVFPQLVESHNSKLATHRDRITGCLIRQKTETHAYRNIFIERFSSFTAMTPGGPWQAFLDGCQVCLHYFPRDGKIIEFLLNSKTIFLIEGLCRPEYRKEIPNNGYTTVGFAIPIKRFLPVLGSYATVKTIEPIELTEA